MHEKKKRVRANQKYYQHQPVICFQFNCLEVNRSYKLMPQYFKVTILLEPETKLTIVMEYYVFKYRKQCRYEWYKNNWKVSAARIFSSAS